MLALTGQVFAASALYARISAPQSPTNQTDLSINVVVLNQNQAPVISVQCYWRKSGGSWNALGSAINVIAGGNNTANCQTGSNEIHDDGTYEFYASVNDGANTFNTQTVSVNFTRSGPGTPTNYGKDKPSSCTYQIKFKTADDGGKTAKVEIYRSTNTAFVADGSTKIATIGIGSNQDGSYNDNVPDCNANYYYAVRAFDSAGNGSGVVGDSETKTVVSTTTTGTAQPGAIPAGTGGNILGVETAGAPTGPSGAILGEEASGSPTPAGAYTPPTPNLFTGKNLGWGALGIAGILLVVWLLRKKQD